MGMLEISTKGSFPKHRSIYFAQDYGHAHAVAEAIRYLSDELLPWAITRDHELQNEGSTPDRGFDRND